MKKSLLISVYLLLVVVSCSAFAQDISKTVAGRILDKENSAPIPFASVYLKGKSIGTTSNEEGFFVFHFPSDHVSDIIVISAIGYASIEKKVDAFSKNQIILLSSKFTELDEVQVTAAKKKALTAKDIIRKAYDQIENNYPMEPYVMEGFIRDLQKEDGKYVEYLECAARFLDKGLKVKRNHQVELIGVRSNLLAPKHPWNKNSERKNSIIDLIEDNFIKFDYGPINTWKGWRYEIEDILPYDGKLVYKISGIDKPFQTATIYIDTQTYAFVRLELTRAEHKGRSWRRRFTNGALQVYYNVVFEYQEFNGKMYLKYQKEEDSWRIYKGLESRKILFTKNPKKELFINKISHAPNDLKTFNKNMDMNTSIENQGISNDMEFWSTYNVPKQTEEESKIVAELKKL